MIIDSVYLKKFLSELFFLITFNLLKNLSILSFITFRIILLYCLFIIILHIYNRFFLIKFILNITLKLSFDYPRK